MQSVNLTSAFVTAQFMLLVLVFVGIATLRAGEKEIRRSSLHPRPATLLYPILFSGFSLVTFGLLIFSEDILSSARPVFNEIKMPSLTRDVSFVSVFVLDLLGATYLIRATGGSQNSPFSAILFLLPTLAIFLREPPERFLSYAFGAAILFLVGQVEVYSVSQENSYHRMTYSFVTLGCIALSTMVGYATRPL